jgi:competence protein ComEC
MLSAITNHNWYNWVNSKPKAAVFDIIKSSPGFEDLWQLHYSFAAGEEKNSPEQFIANMEQEQQCRGKMIKVSVQKDGSFTVTNARNDFSKTYKPKEE